MRSSSSAAEAVASNTTPNAILANYLCQPELAVINQRQELQECVPAGFEVEHGVFVANVLDQQNLLGAVLHRAGGKIQLIREVQDGSSTSGFDRHNELFSFSYTGQHVGIILPGRGATIICGNPNMVKITVKGKIGVIAGTVYPSTNSSGQVVRCAVTDILAEMGRAGQASKPIFQ